MKTEDQSKRCSQESAGNTRHVKDGHLVISACGKCRTFSYPICTGTGEDIAYPATGPIGKKCPLPKYEFPEDAA